MKTTKADPKARFPSDHSTNDSVREYIDKFATLAGSELDGSFGESEERVVSTPPDVFARVNTSTTLADDDGAGMDSLAVKTLHTKTLALGVAAVTG